MKKKEKPLTQPLMMRRDYDDHDKDASMMKKVAPIDYDDLEVKKSEGFIFDYDDHCDCDGGCFLCDR